MASEIYADIAQRTNGDIYIGVVGPVRSGKSTFIKRFMEQLVIPNIPSEARRERAVDELPQSAGGRTIMTTEPKFIPEEAVELTLGEAARLRLRMIDCVGYIIPSALGYIENDQPRMVHTPWFDEEVPFNMAAEVGTRKVIAEHSTIGLVVTTDGSITDLPRAEYAECEQRVIEELQELGKPFAVLLNCLYPHSKESQALAEQLRETYNAPVIPVSCPDLDEADIRTILTELLRVFPVQEINICMPHWITELEKHHWLRESVFSCIRQAAGEVHTIRDTDTFAEAICTCPYITGAAIREIHMGTGSVIVDVSLDAALFYRILGEETGLEIHSESDLLPILMELSRIQKEYAKIEPALREVEATGYGIVMPDQEEMTLEEPEIIKQGGRYGVRLRASAPSIHMMRADIRTTDSPIVGTERQSEELVMYLLEGFEEDPAKIWSSNIFGKSLHELVGEGLDTKLSKMPRDARLKLQETLQRIINEGCSGLICFIL